MGCLGPRRPASPPRYYAPPPSPMPIYAPSPYRKAGGAGRAVRASDRAPSPAAEATPRPASSPPTPRPKPRAPATPAASPSLTLPLPLRVGTIRTEPSVQEEIQVFVSSRLSAVTGEAPKGTTIALTVLNGFFYHSVLQLQSKREQFFKNELPSSPAMPGPAPGGAPNVPPPTAPAPSAIKEALAKRAAERGRLQNGNVQPLRLCFCSIIAIAEFTLNVMPAFIPSLSCVLQVIL